jgi:outer membrane protein assembly factor BamB
MKMGYYLKTSFELVACNASRSFAYDLALAVNKTTGVLLIDSFLILSVRGKEIYYSSTEGVIRSSQLVADVTGDGFVDIVFASGDGVVRCVNASNGYLWWQFATDGPIYFSSPVGADIDGDGRLEVIIGSDDFNLYVLNGTGGDKLWNYTMGENGYIEATAAIANLTADPYLEIVIGSYDGYVYALNASGGLLWKFYAGQVWSSAAIADLNATTCLI